MSKGNTGRKILAFFVGIVLLLVVLLGVGEFLMRKQVSNNLRSEIGTNASGDEASVHFGATPLLLSLLTKNIKHVEVDTPSTIRITHPDNQNYPDVSGTPKSHITVDDLDISDPDHAVARSLQLDTTISNDYLQAELQRQFGMAKEQDADSGSSENSWEAFATELLQSMIDVTKVSTDVNAGTLTLEFNNGVGTVTLSPAASNGKLSFQDVQSTLLGIELPAEVNDALASAINSGIEIDNDALTFDKIEVRKDGLFVVISGTDVDLSEVQVTGASNLALS